MSAAEWYLLAQLAADRPGWEEEKARVEAAIRHAAEVAGEGYEEVVFAAWSRLPNGGILYHYETRSSVLCECFYLAELTMSIVMGRPPAAPAAVGDLARRWVCPGDEAPRSGASSHPSSPEQPDDPAPPNAADEYREWFQGACFATVPQVG